MAAGASRAGQRRGRATGTLVLAALASTALVARAQALRDSDVVARVNGTPIYRKAVREVVRGVLLTEEGKPDPGNVQELAEQALDSLVALELLYQESRARGITVSDADVSQEIARSRSHFPNAAAFKALLRAKGMTDADLREDTRKTMAVERLLEGTVLKDVRADPEQIRSFYEQNKELFKHPAEIRVSHILVRLPEHATPAQRTKAAQKAAELLAKLRAGTDFAALARTASEDPVSAARGGDLGYVAHGDLDAAFERAAFALPPGQLSDVIETHYGLHIIKVTGRRDAGYAPLPEVQERISEILLKQARERQQAAFVATLRSRANVQILDRGGD